MKLLPVLTLILITVNSCSVQDNTSGKGQSQSAETNTVIAINTLLTASEFKAIITQAESPQLIDVRTPDEYAQGNIEGAVNININDQDFIAQLQDLDKEKPVYLYCRSGGRSGRAAKMIEAEGFIEIYDLKGGFMNYK